MKFRGYLLVTILQLSLFVCAMMYSNNGLLDLFGLRSQVDRTDRQIAQIENENKEFRRRLDVIEKQPRLALEDVARRDMGYAHKGERVYLQSH